MIDNRRHIDFQQNELPQKMAEEMERGRIGGADLKRIGMLSIFVLLGCVNGYGVTTQANYVWGIY